MSAGSVSGGNWGCTSHTHPMIWIPGAKRAFDDPVAWAKENGPKAVTGPLDELSSMAAAFMARFLIAMRATGRNEKGP